MSKYNIIFLQKCSLFCDLQRLGSYDEYGEFHEKNIVLFVLKLEKKITDWIEFN